MEHFSRRRVDLLRRGVKGSRCALSPLDVEHTDWVVAWRNDPENSTWFLSHEKFTAEGHERWLSESLAGDNDFNWLIQGPTGSPVGTVGLYHVEWSEKRAEFGRLLIGNPDFRRAGYGGEASYLVLDLARRAGLEECHLVVKEDNVGAIAIYRRLGFRVATEEGKLLQMTLSLSCLATSEFTAPRPTT